MLRKAFYATIVLLVMCTGMAMGQCPVNIGFDLGSFTNWQGATGTIGTDGTVTLPNSGTGAAVFGLISRAAQQVDYYGQFSLSSPNGSSTVAQLGDNTTGSAKTGLNKAQRLTYTFTVPANSNEFSLIYYYAVVLEDPPNDASHTDLTKPKFRAAVFNVTDNQYTNCADFNFVSISNLPGFTKAPVQKNNDVYYKDWSPVTIDLRGYAGKTLRLEFTTNNCAPGGHFAYAYIDVNENCASPVSGNVICKDNPDLTLVAPAGFAGYTWFNGKDFTHPIASTSTYTISPRPVPGTMYSVAIQPYPGLGCPDTITTTIQDAEPATINIKPTLQVCGSLPFNIQDSSIFAGSTSTLTYTYYTNIAATPQYYVTDPTNITLAGTYYIKATTLGGCEYVEPIVLSYLVSPVLKITSPPQVCAPATIDITNPAITQGSQNIIGQFSYFTDAAATIPLNITDAQKISKTGRFYIKTTNGQCSDIQPITVTINQLPVLLTNPVSACEKADITIDSATVGSSSNVTFSYFYDAAGTQSMSMASAKAITTRGASSYYIQATSTITGCSSALVKIDVHVYDYPQSTVTDPPAVVFPATVDITHAFSRQTGTVYYFYTDSLCTKLIADATQIGVRGTYYVKAVNGNDCALILPIKVTINPPPDVDYSVNTFTPNGDGYNDIFLIKLNPAIKLHHFRIYGSWGGLIFDTTSSTQGWDGTYNGKKMPVGTYYWVMDAYDTYYNKTIKQSGSITLVM
jgi:gliding motility-associated-like protein